MKRVYVNEKWCLCCHLCEYYCAFANLANESEPSALSMTKILKGKKINPLIKVEGDNNVSFAVNCRHCIEPLCLKACIAGALDIVDGIIVHDKDKCVGCHSCILVCPYGCIVPAEDHSVIQKCELCTNNSAESPACVKGCPNQAIVFEDKGIPASREAWKLSRSAGSSQ
jgi:carbon-monoxide dehydrogenase iron sulfur subunit